MNRADLQKLAEERLADAQVLLASGRFSGVYYLAGYVVECALKACVAKLTKPEDFPNRRLANTVYTHDLKTLANETRLAAVFAGLAKGDRQLENWRVVSGWSEESRYESRSEDEAKEMLTAVSDPICGVLQCIKQYW